MDKNQIRKEIAALINSIKEHSDNIGQKEHVPQLELELILHKIEKLYQKSIVFNHLNSFPNVYVQPPAEKRAVEPVKEEVKPLTLKEETKVDVKPEVKPVDLFGAEFNAPQEKAKADKKPEKEDKKEIKPLTAGKIQRPAITDIRAAIGINDKFQYINELFSGNAQEYEIAVQQLNTAETIDSAMEYFMSIQQLYSWDNEHETVKRLFDLVERRYS
ncbi:MAG TPA: hypothetical protein VF868_04250 [Bacteroidia bacterium]|jgi:hypothetical protein